MTFDTQNVSRSLYYNKENKLFLHRTRKFCENSFRKKKFILQSHEIKENVFETFDWAVYRPLFRTS